MEYTGALSFFFPCKIKDEGAIRRLNKRWNKWRIKREEFIKKNNEPLTDLMDLETDREWDESLLSMLQGSIRKEYIDVNIRPYALKCLQTAYRSSRENHLFSKSVSVVLSYFHLRYEGNESKPINCEGTLLFNVNADNKVGTFIITLNFKELFTNEIIILKHIFYKRLKISIDDYSYDFCSCKHVCELVGIDRSHTYNCLKRHEVEDGNMNNGPLTVPQYILSKTVGLSGKLEYDIDFRARYSLLSITEITDTIIQDKEKYALLKADEMYDYLPAKFEKKVLNTKISTRKYHEFYLNGQNGLIIYNENEYKKYWSEKQRFVNKLVTPEGYINAGEVNFGSCIPGVKENYFPKFLKSVELHYLLNLIQTNEIGHREQSFWNIFILFRRIKKLWNVIYELDFNKYYIHPKILQSFGVNKMMNEIRGEFEMTLTHIIGYIALIFTLLQFIL